MAAALAAFMGGAAAPPDAEAAAASIREQLNEVRDEIRAVNERVNDQQSRADDLRVEMLKADKAIRDARDDWRKARVEAGKSWDSINAIHDAERAVRDAKSEADRLRAELADAIRTASSLDRYLDVLRDRAASLSSERRAGTAADTSDVGIRLSAPCEALVRLGDNSTCLSYSALQYLDVVLEPYTGPLEWEEEHNDLRRQKEPVKRLGRLYDSANGTGPYVVLDPPTSLNGELRILWIVPSVPPTSPHRTEIDSTWKETKHLPYLHTRMDYSHCTEMILGLGPVKDKHAAVVDSVNMLRSGCTMHSNVTVLGWTEYAPSEPARAVSALAWERGMYYTHTLRDACSEYYGQCRPPPPYPGSYEYVAPADRQRLNDDRGPRPVKCPHCSHAFLSRIAAAGNRRIQCGKCGRRQAPLEEEAEQ